MGKILIEQHAKQSISRDRNNQKAARQANPKHPSQDMSQNRGQEIEHISLEPIGAILARNWKLAHYQKGPRVYWYADLGPYGEVAN